MYMSEASWTHVRGAMDGQQHFLLVIIGSNGIAVRERVSLLCWPALEMSRRTQ
jgi:hypothetical protein